MKYLVFGILLLILLPTVLSLNIISPEYDRKYNSSIVLLNISEDIKSDFFLLDGASGNSWKKICEKKELCTKNIRAKEGLNVLKLKSVDINGISSYGDVSFDVDTKKPKIITTTPYNNALTNGKGFSIKYSEENLDSIILYYGTPGNYLPVLNTDCESGIGKKCDFDKLNLLEFDGTLINYWFVVSDGVNSVSSKMNRVKVDSLSPELVNKEDYFTVDRNVVSFTFEVDEKNFKDIIYKDTNDCNVKSVISGILCGKLSYGRCVITKTFCVGNHEILITIRDKAGNSQELDPISLTRDGYSGEVILE